MRELVSRILSSFGYEDLESLGESLAPSLRYHFTVPLIGISTLGALITRIFGIDFLAFAGLLLVFMVELSSGVHAAMTKGETFSFVKFSRFTFKIFYYLLIIAISHLMSISFQVLGKDVAAGIFSYMHMFLVIQIVLENIVSISENLATVSGKEKSSFINALIKRLKEKI